MKSERKKIGEEYKKKEKSEVVGDKIVLKVFFVNFITNFKFFKSFR